MSSAVLLEPGHYIDSYKIIKLIGHTKTSHVYLVASENLHKPLVLKLSIGEALSAKKAFITEAKLLLECSNEPNVAKIMHLGKYEGRDFILMHYYASTLLSLLSVHDSKMPFSITADLIKQMLIGLSSLHKRHTLHLDIKPENMFVDNTQSLFIADFNNALVKKSSPLYKLLGLEAEEAVSITRLSPRFSAPELENVVNKKSALEDLTPATDLYSVGVTWFLLLTGKYHESHLIIKKELANLAPQWAAELIAKMLSFQTDKRPSDAQACADIIAAYQRDSFESHQENETITVALDEVSSAVNKIKSHIDTLLVKQGFLSTQDNIFLCDMYKANSSTKTNDKFDQKQVLEAVAILFEESKAQLVLDRNMANWFAWSLYVHRLREKSGQLINSKQYYELLQVGRASRPDDPKVAENLLKRLFSTSTAPLKAYLRSTKYMTFIIFVLIVLYWISNKDANNVAPAQGVLPNYADGLVEQGSKNQIASANTRPLNSTAEESRAQTNSLDASNKTAQDNVKQGYYVVSHQGTEINIPWLELPALGHLRIMRTEVTQALYRFCIDEGSCRSTKRFSTAALKANKEAGTHPKTKVSWYEVTKEFIPWLNRKTGLNFDLPSYEQWQYFSQASANTMANIHCKDCPSNRYVEYRSSTMPVNLLEADEFGLYHVHGNAQEWLKDCWKQQSNFSDKPTLRCDQAMVAGGSWRWQKKQWKSEAINKLLKNAQTPTTGFRLVEHKK